MAERRLNPATTTTVVESATTAPGIDGAMDPPVGAPARPGPRTLRTAKAIVLLTVCEVLGKLGTLIVVVGAARLLSLDDFGAFAVALGVGALAAVIPSWGFDNLLVQRGAAEPAVLPTVLTELVALRTGLAVGVLAASGGLAVALGVPGHILVPAGCVVLACLAETVADAFRAVAVAREAPTVVAAAQLVQRGVTAVLVVAALLVAPSLLSVSLAYLLGTAIGVAATALGAARLGVRPRWSRLHRAGIAQFSRASGSGGLHVVASMALFRIDAVLLAALAGAAAAGRYAAGYRLLETVVFVAWTVARSVFPIMASSPEMWRVRRGAERGLVVLASVFLPYHALLWCRGADVMATLYGDSFPTGDIAMLTWLAPAPLLFGAGYLAAYVLMSDGPNARVLVGSVGALSINVALNLLLIPRHGPVGAAAATTISYAAQVALLYPAARRRAGRPALLRPLLPAAVASLAAAGVLLAVGPFWPAVLLAGVVYLGAFLWLAARFDPEQVGVVRGLLGQGLPARQLLRRASRALPHSRRVAPQHLRDPRRPGRSLNLRASPDLRAPHEVGTSPEAGSREDSRTRRPPLSTVDQPRRSVPARLRRDVPAASRPATADHFRRALAAVHVPRALLPPGLVKRLTGRWRG